MSYRVRIESFEGPFDLLLYLVSRQKVDIGSISITEIVDQYVAYIDRMQKLDLEVASDFLLVASTLLDIKAASLIPSEKTEVEDELEELSPNAVICRKNISNTSQTSPPSPSCTSTATTR